MIVGPCGSGKSTLAARLGSLLRIPAFHMDFISWEEGWTETPDDKLEAALAHILEENDAWIIDGNDSSTMPQRLKLADAVLYLDFHPLLCTWRVLKRVWRLRGQTRPDMADGCPERFDLGFLIYVLTWNGGPRRKNAAVLSGYEDMIVRFSSPRALETWLDGLCSSQEIPNHSKER